MLSSIRFQLASVREPVSVAALAPFPSDQLCVDAMVLSSLSFIKWFFVETDYFSVFVKVMDYGFLVFDSHGRVWQVGVRVIFVSYENRTVRNPCELLDFFGIGFSFRHR